ncbi:MAG: ABC transporter permease [Lentisphaerae bacterium]|nr:ABC transporter permease [Lentisphaerota bacterium]
MSSNSDGGSSLAFSRWLRHPGVRALAALLLVLSLGLIFNAEGAFFKWATHRDMLRHVAVFGILACGMTLVIISAGIDLAVGSILGLSAVSFALFSLRWGFSPWLAVPATLLVGGLCGAASGGLIARFRLQPFIVTLAMMVFARGLAKWVSGGQKISTAIELADGTYRYGMAPPFLELLNAKVLQDNVAVVTLIFLACVICCWLLLAKLRWGRYLYAIGGGTVKSYMKK